MALFTPPSFGTARRLGRFALTALLIGLGGAGLVMLPFGHHALAANGNGNGGGSGGGKGGGNGGGHGGHGGGNGGGQSGDRGGGHKDQGGTKSGRSAAGGESSGATDDSADTIESDDDSMSANNLGKLNGFFHASAAGLANASPNSSIGRISHVFKEALSSFSAASDTATDPNDPNATPPRSPSIDDLGAILARATNKKVTATQVKEIIDRLAQENPDDAKLNDLAGSIDDATCQDIADAANAARSGDLSADTSDDSTADSTDTSNPTDFDLRHPRVAGATN
jgi:hypothetical protein